MKAQKIDLVDSESCIVPMNSLIAGIEKSRFLYPLFLLNPFAFNIEEIRILSSLGSQYVGAWGTLIRGHLCIGSRYINILTFL